MIWGVPYPMRQRFSLGNKCECMCHGKVGIVDFCGYCTTSHRTFSNNRSRR